ncbi:MAG: TRAP transporter substrate-binding protein [Proteobacteria bacterium]|nr:TRAP transporter substrate-binding protein [Pseudomonadota bacterium]
MTSDTPRTPSMSLKAAVVAIVVAFVVGVVASLAIRPRSVQAGAAGGGAGQADATAAVQQLDWRVPIAFASTLPALGDNIVYVSEALKKASGGAINWEVYEPGKLVPPFGITDGVKDQKIQAGYTWLGYDQGKIPSAPLISAVPFGMEPWEFAAWWFEGDGKSLAEAVYAEHNVHPLLCGVIGPETAGWFRSEIKSAADFRGIKIRFAGLGGKVMQRMGASVTMLPGGEIFQALEKGAIDATEFSMPAIDKRLGFDRVVKLNYYPGWHQPYTAFHVLINKDLWQGLNETTQALIETTCTAGVLRNLARGEALQGGIIASFPDQGITAKRIPVELLRQLQKVTAEVLTEEAGKDDHFAKIYRSQRDFSASYHKWKSLAYLPRDF